MLAWLGTFLGEELSVDVHTVLLSETPVTDVGIEHLRGLTQLCELALANTRITDAGLKHLHGLAQLQWLVLHNTAVTDAGVTELKKALPDLQIQLYRRAAGLDSATGR